MANAMIQKCTVHRFPHDGIASKAKTDVGHASAHVCTGQMGSNPLCRFKEVEGVSSVLLHACGHGKNIGVENDVGGVKMGFVDQETVGPFTDFDSARVIVGLTLLVECHDNHCGTVSPDGFGLLQKGVLSFLEAN